MHYTENMKYASFIIFPAMIILLLLLAGFQWLPTRQLSLSAMRTVSLQQARSSSLASDALVLGYIADPTSRSQAIGDMEATLPQFEADQSAMGNYHNPDLQNMVAQSRSDYLAIDIAAKMVLAQAHSGAVDKYQVMVVREHSYAYSDTMMQVATTLHQASGDALLRLFYIEIAIDGGVIVLIVTLGFILRGNARAILREYQRSPPE